MAELRVKSTGTLKLFESDNTSSVTIASPASLGADRTITLPDASVTLASGTMLATDGSGASLTALNASELGSGTVPAARLSGVGKVLQTIMATDGTKRSLTTATSFATGSNTLSVDITPSATSSKILIMVNTDIQCTGNADTSYFTVYRDSTNVQDVQSGYSTFYSLTGAYANWDTSMNYTSPMTMIALDSPSSTSAITYQVYWKVPGASNTSSINAYSAGRIIVQEIGA
jgi:hypothetical protein